MVTTDRRASITTGALFILATAAALVAAALDQTLTGKGYLMAVGNHPDRQSVAALFYLIAAGASAAIAIALFPVLERLNRAVAMGSVVFRAIEAVLYTTAVVSLLSVRPLGQHVATTPAQGRATTQAMADAALSVRDHSTLAGVIAFSVGASMYYGLLYRSRLVPRWLSGWGVAGVALMVTACLLALFSGRPVTGYTLLILPILVQELVLAGWLLVRGFDPAPLMWSAPRNQPTPRRGRSSEEPEPSPRASTSDRRYDYRR